MAKWLLVDGYNMAFRAFYGMPELTRADGFPTGALHGWVKTMWRLQDQEKPDAMVVFFDLGGSQERLALHPEYKAQRKETPEPLERQIPVIKELTRAMGLVGVELDGVESDDLLAAQARLLAKDGHDVLIVSADKDFAQCVDERIKILLPPPTANPKLGWRVLDPAGVVEKFGVPPAQIAEYLALIGDSSDNIPGISGVGPKTAVKWFQEFQTLEGIIAHAAELKPERFPGDGGQGGRQAEDEPEADNAAGGVAAAVRATGRAAGGGVVCPAGKARDEVEPRRRPRRVTADRRNFSERTTCWRAARPRVGGCKRIRTANKLYFAGGSKM
jgi:DNA polymerase-1